MSRTLFRMGCGVLLVLQAVAAHADYLPNGTPATLAEREEWSLAARSSGAKGLRFYGTLLRSNEGVGPRVLDSPFLDYALLAALPDLYESVYESQKKKAYDEQVKNLKTVTLYDGFIDMVASGSVPEEMKSAGDQVGACLARRINQAAQSCPISEPAKGKAPKSPPLWKLGWARLTCGALANACWARKAFYAAAYPELLKYRDDPKVRELVAKKFEEIFPGRFFQEFRSTIDQYRSNLSAVLAPKIGVPDFAEAKKPLLQADGVAKQKDRSLVRMDGFALGLMADVLAAKAGLSQGASVDARRLGASGLWAAGQRLIELTGMDGAKFKDGRYAWGDQPVPGKAPAMGSVAIGGWSAYWVPAPVGRTGSGLFDPSEQLRFQRWDWEQYYQLPDTPGSVTRIFPHAFEIDSNGTPYWSGPESAEHRLNDMVLLAEGLIELLTASQKGAVLSKYFGSREELKEILEPSVSVVLPRQFRSLSYGVLAALARNLLHPDIGLLEVQDHIEPGMGLGVRFFEKHSFLESRDTRQQASTAAVARLIIVASKMRSLLLSDQEVPVDQKRIPDLINKIDSLIQVGALTLGADAQVVAGGFRPVLGSKDLTSLDFGSSLLGMRAIQAAYGWSQMPVMKLNLAAGMKWLKAQIDSTNLLFGPWTPEERVNLWHWIELYDGAQPEWRDAVPEGGERLDWAQVRSELELRLLNDARVRAKMNR